MSVLLVESAPDPASVSIAAALRTLAPWAPTQDLVEGEPVHRLEGTPDVGLVRTARLHLEAEPFGATLRASGRRPDALVFLSKHRAASGRPSLTVHPVGNFAEAKFGGRPGRVGPCPPALMSELLRALKRGVATSGYAAEVTFEATHHGPLIETPSCFIELGSSDAQWRDPAGARVVAEALLDVVRRPLPAYPVALGLGGGHYAPRFTEAALSRRVHFAHMITTPLLETLADPDAALAEALRASPGAAGAYLHRKMIERDVLDRWKAALDARGVPLLESGSWPVLEDPAPPGPGTFAQRLHKA